MARYPKQATFNYWVHVGPRVQALLDEGHSIRLWEHPAEGLLANLKDLPEDLQKEVGIEAFDRICRGLRGVPVPREDVKETVGESFHVQRDRSGVYRTNPENG